jgi:ketosteroid isomerase-like protein
MFGVRYYFVCVIFANSKTRHHYAPPPLHLIRKDHTMPARPVVDAFVALVAAGKYVEAIEGYYADDASMQENQSPPRAGRANLVLHEKKMAEVAQSPRTTHAEVVAIDGDTVVIRWGFAFVDEKGAPKKMDELAWQQWRDNKIVRERFYYDSAPLQI